MTEILDITKVTKSQQNYRYSRKKTKGQDQLAKRGVSVLTYKTFSEMGLNYRIMNFIKVMLDPCYGSDMSGLPRETNLILPGQRVARKWGQR